eukprot:5624117-Prymnesium_polylepis.1
MASRWLETGYAGPPLLLPRLPLAASVASVLKGMDRYGFSSTANCVANPRTLAYSRRAASHGLSRPLAASRGLSESDPNP